MSNPNSDKATLRIVKIIILILILISGCFVFFPFMKVVKDRKNGCCKGKFFSLLTCFAAGMLLSISIVHIMPEANALYIDYLKDSEKAELAGGNTDDHRRFRIL